MGAEIDKEVQRVMAVVLAYSRLDYLKQLVDALEQQSAPPDKIVVVDQSSDPALQSWLDSRAGIEVVRQANAGSAGGFTRGILEGCRAGFDWVWIFDDDAIPEPGALEALRRAPFFTVPEVSFLVSRIVDRHGAGQQPPAPDEPNSWIHGVAGHHCVKVRRASWLGLMVRTAAVARAGLPIAEFFIWHEDQEFTERLSAHGPAWCVLDSVIVHYQRPEFDPFNRSDYFKLAHGIRNEIGWIKVSRAPIHKKLLRAIRASANTLRRVVRREIPAGSIVWLVRGWLFFWPRVRMP